LAADFPPPPPPPVDLPLAPAFAFLSPADWAREAKESTPVGPPDLAWGDVSCISELCMADGVGTDCSDCVIICGDRGV
jgi:hypothetical protein